MHRQFGLAIVLLLATQVVARADVVQLKNGGEIRGQLLKAPTKDRVSIRTLTGAEITVSQAVVQAVVHRRLMVEEYETRRRVTPDTVEEQWKLAEWCREVTLPRERERHLNRVITLDPEHVLAHRGLGHVQHEGEWTTRDEIMRSRGYVKYKGRWLLPQELEHLVASEKESEAEKGWYKKVNMWHGWIDGDKEDRREEGLRNLVAINDANAVPALYKAFSQDASDNQRLMYVQILGKIGGEKTVTPLVYQMLQDQIDFVRLAAARAVDEAHHADAAANLVRALKHDLNTIVNRAAAALALLGDESHVPALIDALVTRHKYRVWTPEASNSVSIGPSGQMQGGNVASNLPPDVAVMILTGQLPQGAQIDQQTTPVSPVRRKLVTVQRDEQNHSTLSTLRTLTGQDFGFEERQWKQWWNASRSGSSK